MCDDFEIRTLPANFVCKSRPSKIINKLNAKRKVAHDEALKTMREQQLQLNADTNAEIEKESAAFIEKLKTLKEAVASIIFTIQFEYREMQQNIFVADDIVSKHFHEVSSSYEALQKRVDAFHEVLLEIEKKRSEKSKVILNEASTKVAAAAHVLPLEAERFFCGEILELNKITMNNYQSFAELKQELKLQVSGYMKTWTDQLLEVKESQKHSIKELSRKSIQRLRSVLKSDLAIISQSEDIMDAMKILESLQNDLQWLNDSQLGIPVCRQDVERWLRDVQKTLASLDLTARNLVSLYKAVIIILFNRFFTELTELKESMAKSGLVPKDDIEDFQSEIYTPTFEELNLQFENEFEVLQQLWEEKLDEMKESIETTYTFLKGSASLWDRHFMRVIELKTCVLLDLENTVELNSQSSMVYEAELNIQLERLRQGSDEKTLDKHLADVQGTLDKIENLYKIYSDKENQVVQKYRTMIEIGIDVLMSEIQRFLTLHPPDPERDPKIQRKRASQCSEKEINVKDLLIPNQILYCTFQVDATKNWMFGLWEAIKTYMSTGRAEILVLAEQWMDKQRKKIDDRLRVKLAFHSPRYFRIKCSIFNKRLKELRTHSERLSSHKTAAEQKVLSLKNQDRSIEEEFSKICSQFVTKTNELLQKAEGFEKSREVRGLLLILEPQLRSHKELMAKPERDYYVKCMGVLNEIKVCGYVYLKSARLFSEQGSFSVEEITFLQKQLTKLEQYTTKTIQKYTNDVKTKLIKYSGFLDNAYANSLSTFEELIRELEHNENVVKLMEKLRKDIKNEVISVKTTMKKLENDAMSLMQKSLENVDSIEKIEVFVEKYDDVIQRMQDFVKFMGSPPTKAIGSVHTSLSGHISHLAQKSHMDHDIFLSNIHVNRDNHTFLSKLNELLTDSYSEIKKRSKDFYAKHHILLLDHTRLQPSHELCLDEVHRKYKNYHAQCEACWHEIINEFLDISINFRELKNEFPKEFDRLGRQNGLDRYKSANRAIVEGLEDRRKKVEVEFRVMLRRLKTLYGHPHNKVLLDELVTAFDDFESNFDNLEEIYITQKEALLNEYNKEVQYFKRVQETLSILNADERLLHLIDSLKHGMTVETFTMQKCHLLDSESDSSKETERKYVDPKSTLNYFNPKACSLSTVSSSSTGSAGGPEEYLEELERTCRMDVKIVEDFVRVHLVEHVQECKRIWRDEVEFIRGLFKVKYDEKNVF